MEERLLSHKAPALTGVVSPVTIDGFSHEARICMRFFRTHLHSLTAVALILCATPGIGADSVDTHNPVTAAASPDELPASGNTPSPPSVSVASPPNTYTSGDLPALPSAPLINTGTSSNSIAVTADAVLPAVPYDLWDRIREGFALEPLNDNQRIASQIAWFSARPDYVERTVERSRRYLYFIVEEVQRRGIPTEIALLPIVESAFNPHALSRSQASGMWQFIPSTGRLYGLKQDWWYDGRRDVVAATNSALDYLQKLHDEFGSWELALAGYNCGEGKIRREIAYNRAHNLPTDYLSLRLPDETRYYLPKLMAAKAVVLEPERYGLTLAPIADQPFFAAVTTSKQIDMKVAAKFANMSVEDFLMLNPGFNRPVISLDFNKEKTILVPAAAADAFVTRLADPQVKLVSWKSHQLRRGEHLDKVAGQFGLSSDELKRVNGISKNKNIAGGGTILVPDAAAASDIIFSGNGKPESEIPAPGVLRVKFMKGDSLASLAEKYGTSTDQIQQWNHFKPGHKMRAGQMLIVQQGDAPAAKPKKKHHKPGVRAR
jgi:membrane-bound lytic murein transglycosylase D